MHEEEQDQRNLGGRQEHPQPDLDRVGQARQVIKPDLGSRKDGQQYEGIYVTGPFSSRPGTRSLLCHG